MRDNLDDALVGAFVERAQRDLAGVTLAQLDEGWQRLQQPRSRTATLRPTWGRRRPPLLAWLAGCAAAGLVLGLVMLGYRARPARPLAYTVEGVVAGQGNTIEASAHAVSRLRFSDESSIALDAATRLTVDALDARGARIGLLDGAIEVFVKPRQDGSWRFSAGPFAVRVTGTAFRLAFASSLGRLQLQMRTGHVEVLGPTGRTAAVGAGEAIELFATPQPPPVAAAPMARVAGHGDSTATPNERPPVKDAHATPESPRRRAAVSPIGAPAAPPAGASGPTQSAPSPAWTQWLGQGKFSQVVADAEQRGIGQVIAQAGSADLAALADAARYIKRYPLSRQVLLGMRSRFAATESAHDAAFFLGRLAEATAGDGPALDWYDTYLREAPRGLYAKAAMGREMRLRAAGSRERARQLAREYLEHFPQGPEADLAKSLVEAHTE